MLKAAKITAPGVSPFGQWFEKGEDKALVSLVNRELLCFKGEINDLKIPVFGSSLYLDNGTSCVFHNANSIIASVVADRYIRKFEAPSYDDERLLKRRCSASWIDFENTHLSTFEGRVGRDQSTSRASIRARKLVKNWLAPKKAHQKSFWQYIEEAPFDFGPGESFSGTQGDTSVFSKILPSMIFPVGTVSIENAALAAYFIAANKAARSQYVSFLKRRGNEKYPSEPCQSSMKQAFDEFQRPDRKNTVKNDIFYVARRIYSEIFFAYPVDHKDCLVKRGSRGSSVYKDSEKRRFINIECLWDSVIQKNVGYAIRQCLKYNARIDLDDGQAYHRYLIRRGVTTIDESNASDSIVHSFLSDVLSFDKRLSTLVNLTRASFVLIDEEIPTGYGTFAYRKSWYHSKKTSSMGNGYTFELLSLILGALSRYHDNDASVYGDDIICSNESATDIIADITAAGFIVNQKKSFIDKPFRESCGAFYLEGRGYITCFDIKWCFNVHDVIVIVNKLGRILSLNKGWKHPLRDKLFDLYNVLLGKVPAFLRGPEVHEKPDLPEWVEDKLFLKRQKGSAICKQMADRYSILTDSLTEAWQLTRFNQKGELVPDPEWAIVKVLSPKPLIKIKARFKDIHEGSALFYAYIHSGRVTDIEIRQQSSEVEWEYKTTLVHNSGSAIRAETARTVLLPFDKEYHRKQVIRRNLRKKGSVVCSPWGIRLAVDSIKR